MLLKSTLGTVVPLFLLTLGVLSLAGCDEDEIEKLAAQYGRGYTGHLVISEMAVSPTSGEFIEIHNPTPNPVNLSNVYLADFTTYYLVTQGGAAPIASDFIVKFPSGSSIPSHGFKAIAIHTATDFFTNFGFYPHFDMDAADANAPNMQGTYTLSTTLTDTSEMIVLFSWDGTSDLVTDLDYLLYGDAGDAVDKSGITVGASTYKPDTPVGSQSFATPPASSQSLNRCDLTEFSENHGGGNGWNGHDETSENVVFAFVMTPSTSPGTYPPNGVCP